MNWNIACIILGDSKNSAETETREIFRVKQPLAGGQEKTSVAIPVDNPQEMGHHRSLSV